MAGNVTQLQHDVRMYLAQMRLQLKAAAVLRGAFIMQVAFMVVNNSMLVIAWMFFFTHFGSVNGWTLTDYIGVQGIVMVVFGIMMLSSAGLLEMPRHVDRGSLDSFLTKPSSVLGQVASSNIDITTFGDLLLGFAFMGWYAVVIHMSAWAGLLLFVTLASACIIFWCFAIMLPNIIAFYVFNSENVVRYFAFMFMDCMNYPTGVLSGAFRTVLLTVFPALLVGTVPLDVMRGLRWHWALLSVLLAAFWLWFTLWLFKRSLRRYESANLVGAR